MVIVIELLVEETEREVGLILYLIPVDDVNMDYAILFATVI